MLEQKTYEVTVTLDGGKYSPVPVNKVAGLDAHYADLSGATAFDDYAIGYMQHHKTQRAFSEHAQCTEFSVAATTPTSPVITAPITAVTFHVSYLNDTALADHYDEGVMGAKAIAIPGDWVADRVYRAGDKVTNSGTYYSAKAAHSNGTFTASEWDEVLLEPAAYVPAATYAKGDKVKEASAYYVATAATDAATFALGPWEEITSDEAGVVYDEVDRVIKQLVIDSFATATTTMAPQLNAIQTRVYNTTGGVDAATANLTVITNKEVTLPAAGGSFAATIKRIH